LVARTTEQIVANDIQWKCVRCGETVSDQLGCCWHCGASRDGEIDPEFVHADDVRVVYAKAECGRPQFVLRSLLVCVSCLCVIFAVLRTDVADLYLVAICGVLVLSASVCLYGFGYGLLFNWVKRRQERGN
jgi:hypothetical protein